MSASIWSMELPPALPDPNSWASVSSNSVCVVTCRQSGWFGQDLGHDARSANGFWVQTSPRNRQGSNGIQPCFSTKSRLSRPYSISEQKSPCVVRLIAGAKSGRALRQSARGEWKSAMSRCSTDSARSLALDAGRQLILRRTPLLSPSYLVGFFAL
jgi:hypothetical protein